MKNVKVDNLKLRVRFFDCMEKKSFSISIPFESFYYWGFDPVVIFYHIDTLVEYYVQDIDLVPLGEKCDYEFTYEEYGNAVSYYDHMDFIGGKKRC